MANGIVVFGVGLFVVLAILTVYLLIIAKPRRIQPTDDPILENKYMAQYTKGSKDCWIVDMIFGGNRIGLKLIPKDINLLKYYNKRKRRVVLPPDKLKPFLMWVPREKLISNPRGTVDVDKNRYELEPFSVLDINPDLRNTKSGIIAMQLCSKNNIQTTAETFLNNELNKNKELLLNNLIGEITPEMYKKLEAQHLDSLEINSKKDDKRPASFYPPGRPPV